MEMMGKNLFNGIQLKFGMPLQEFLYDILVLLMENRAGAVDENAAIPHVTGEVPQNGGLKFTQSFNILQAFPPLQIGISPKRSKSRAGDVGQYPVEPYSFRNGKDAARVPPHPVYDRHPQSPATFFNPFQFFDGKGQLGDT